MRWSAQTGTEDLPPSVAPQAEPGSVGMNDAPTSVEEAGSSGRVQIESGAKRSAASLLWRLSIWSISRPCLLDSTRKS